MIVNVQAPVTYGPDGQVLVHRTNRCKLFRRDRVRPVKWTRVVTLDRDVPAGMVRDVARHAADVAFTHYARVASLSRRPAEVRIHFRYA